MIQGLGYSAFAVIAGICEMVARTIAGFILVPKFGYVFVALGSPITMVSNGPKRTDIIYRNK